MLQRKSPVFASCDGRKVSGSHPLSSVIPVQEEFGESFIFERMRARVCVCMRMCACACTCVCERECEREREREREERRGGGY